MERSEINRHFPPPQLFQETHVDGRWRSNVNGHAIGGSPPTTGGRDEAVSNEIRGFKMKNLLTHPDSTLQVSQQTRSAAAAATLRGRVDHRCVDVLRRAVAIQDEGAGPPADAEAVQGDFAEEGQFQVGNLFEVDQSSR